VADSSMQPGAQHQQQKPYETSSDDSETTVSPPHLAVIIVILCIIHIARPPAVSILCNFYICCELLSYYTL